MKEENFTKNSNPIRPIIQENKTPSPKLTSTPGKRTENKIHSKTEAKEENVLNFSIKEQTDNKIIVAIENPDKYEHDSKEFEFTLVPNILPGSFDLADDGVSIHVNNKDPWPGIKLSLKIMLGKDKNIEIK